MKSCWITSVIRPSCYFMEDFNFITNARITRITMMPPEEPLTL
uniref:Uncharacterized protein n=1 Tax=Rhizophora mucronata TaxID=61149 RepID=A0A2P2N8Q2_RHIMU